MPSVTFDHLVDEQHGRFPIAVRPATLTNSSYRPSKRQGLRSRKSVYYERARPRNYETHPSRPWIPSFTFGHVVGRAVHQNPSVVQRELYIRTDLRQSLPCRFDPRLVAVSGWKRGQRMVTVLPDRIIGIHSYSRRNMCVDFKGISGRCFESKKRAVFSKLKGVLNKGVP